MDNLYPFPTEDPIQIKIFNIQRTAYFTGPVSSTPTLSDITITCTTGGAVYTIEVIGGSYCLTSDDSSEWDEGWNVTPEFYCEITQR